MTVNANAIHAARRFIDLHKWPVFQAATMVGNEIQESLMIPSIEGDKGLEHSAHGINQLRDTRFAFLKTFAKSKGVDWTDLDIQIDFVPFELSTTETATLKRLASAKTLVEYCEASIGYFRPKGYKPATPQAGHGWKNRLRNSADVLAAIAPTPVTQPLLPGNANMTLSQKIAATPRGWLESGDQNDLVTALQLALKALGYPLKGTGFYGPATTAAVKDVQAREGLVEDGEAGPVTAKAIEARKGVPYTDQAKPALVRALWLMNGLNEIGIHEVVGRGSNPKILRWAKDEGGYVATVFTDDDIAWCSLYANHLLTAVGLPGTETLWALDWDSDRTWPNKKLPGPALGAFAPMKRSGGGHIGVIAGRFKDGRLALLAGNQGNTVSIAGIPKDRPLSYRWPAGATLPTVVGFDKLPIIVANGAYASET